MPRTAFSLAILLLLAAPSPAAGGQKKPVDGAALVQLMSEASLCVKTNKLSEAMKDYEEADKISHHTCAQCYLGMAEIKRRTGDLSGARDEDDRALKAAGENKQLAAAIYMARGVVYNEIATGPKDKNLKKAEADFRQGFQLNPAMTNAHVNLGVVLIREGRNAEGIAELKAYLAISGASPALAAEARSIIANPDRAREPYVPDFSVSTLESGTITNASLAGKVVLLDFWGTWCPPCRASVPMMAYLHKKYAGREVEIISVSSDNDEQAWKAFIAKHQMDWPESIDLSGQMQRLFQVSEFPTYIVVNCRGIIRFRTDGYGEYTQNAIEDAINKALKEHAKASSR